MDKAISFKDPLVLAIERGEKTMTRRLLHQPPPFDDGDADADVRWATGSLPSPWSVGDRLWVKQRLVRDDWGVVTYGTDRSRLLDSDGGPVLWPWKPATLGAMYCPRWASRLTLEVESVRVERLNEIDEDDAKAEGVQRTDFHNHRECFTHLWDSINGAKPGASWSDNPWVWVITFRRVDGAPVSA